MNESNEDYKGDEDWEEHMIDRVFEKDQYLESPIRPAPPKETLGQWLDRTMANEYLRKCVAHYRKWCFIFIGITIFQSAFLWYMIIWQ